MDSVSTSLMDNKGCNVADNVDLGNDPTQGVVVFSYGNPKKFSSTQWGATAFASPDVTTGQVREASSRAWANAYSGVSGRRIYYNFGDAAGCQTFSQGDASSCGTSGQPGWDSADVYYVSWGASAALPLPQIYNEQGTNAEGWVMINKWALNNSLGKMAIRGPLSQNQACNQVGGCAGVNNTSSQAWSQMVNKMDAKPETIVDMLYSVDIKWQNP
jgi:hypothetical protein